MLDKKRFLQTLGLAKRASAVVTGEELLKAISNHKIYYLILANNSSSRTKKQYRDKSNTYNVAVNDAFSIEEISNALGLKNRVAVGIDNKGLAETLKTYSEKEKEVTQ